MKRILITSLLSAGALGAYAQGMLNFTDYDYGSQITHIYSPTTSSPHATVNGISAADTVGGNPGSTPTATLFPGSVLIGGSATGTGPTAYANGNNFTVQLEALAGTSAVPIGTLLPISQYTVNMNTVNSSITFQYAGNWTPPSFSLSADPGIPGTGTLANGGNGGFADIATACWYSAGGDATLAAAQADPNGVWGESAEVANFGLVEPFSQTGKAPGQLNDQDTDSFSLQTNVPEPSTIALGVMGVTAFLARRKKS